VVKHCPLFYSTQNLWGGVLTMLMEIKHAPVTRIDSVIDVVSKRDGVPIKYVCTSSMRLPHGPADIFYRDTPHPKFGNKYFKLYLDAEDRLMIGNADAVELLAFNLIEDDDGALVYSNHVHDYKQFKNGNVVDGGQDYLRTTPTTTIYKYVVRNGEMVEDVGG
jgi:hypothetical protein